MRRADAMYRVLTAIRPKVHPAEISNELHPAEYQWSRQPLISHLMRQPLPTSAKYLCRFSEYHEPEIRGDGKGD